MERSDTARASFAAAACLGGFLGFVQFAIFFTDLPDAFPPWIRLLAAAAIGAASGWAMGHLRPASWLSLSLLSVWGAIAWGAALGFMSAGGWPAVIGVPAAAALGGSGAVVAWRRRPSRL